MESGKRATLCALGSMAAVSTIARNYLESETWNDRYMAVVVSGVHIGDTGFF